MYSEVLEALRVPSVEHGVISAESVVEYVVSDVTFVGCVARSEGDAVSYGDSVGYDVLSEEDAVSDGDSVG